MRYLKKMSIAYRVKRLGQRLSPTSEQLQVVFVSLWSKRAIRTSPELTLIVVSISLLQWGFGQNLAIHIFFEMHVKMTDFEFV